MSKKNRTSKSNNSQNSNNVQANNRNNNSNNNLAHECNREDCTCTKNNKANEL